MSISLLLADGHALFTAGLSALLEDADDVTIVGTADTGRQAVTETAKRRPDVVVLEHDLPDGRAAEVAKQILAVRPEVKVICLTGNRDREAVLSILDAGAVGYVLKDSTVDELKRAIRAVASGKTYLSASVAGYVVGAYRNHKNGHASSVAGLESLTRREREILTMVAEGHTSKMVAARLGIAPKTAKNHRENLMRKLDLHSVSQLTRFAVREGLVTA